MKPFNLEYAKAGRPVCTRDGRDARILCFDFKSRSHHIVAAVSNSQGKEHIEVFNDNGRRFNNNIEDYNDLMMKGEYKKGYVALYKPSLNTKCVAYATNVYETLEELKEEINMDSCLDIVEVEWEE